ncbi:anti-CBASS protein Acb1 family protein, partial [Xylella fastidiosa]|uniref:anti-CBASS protein Acb1 family protein n=1 Tax=Xylella fastidiosa TaxID=2371 RepID=UPI00288081AC
LAWARLYGGAVLFINVHGQDPCLPFDPASVMPGTRLSLTVLDRWRVALDSGQIDQNPLSETYGQPRCYQIAGSVERVDHSRMIAFSGAELPWEAFRGNGYWHDSVLQAMYNALSRYDTATQGTASMFFEAVVDVLRISGLSDTLSSDQGTQEVHKRFQLAAMMKSFNRMLLLDAKDEYSQKTNHFSGVKDVIEQFMMDISGAADIPATRLFGQSPQGMNATGDSDIRNYYDRIKAQQEDELRPVLRLLYEVLFRASVGECPHDLEIQFNSLWQMSQTEQASIEKLRAERDQIYLTHGVIGPDVPCAELLEQKTYSKLTERDVTLAAELSQAMEPPDVLPLVETTASASNT